MREIRFRGKRDDTGEWVYGAFVPDALEGLNDLVSWGFIRNYNREIGKMQTLEVERDTVGQYTGLHDKNGKEIYEGDIIQMPHTAQEGYKVDKNGNIQTPVVWNEKWLRWETGYGMGFGMAYGIEVIGNIHDNPELLVEVKG